MTDKTVIRFPSVYLWKQNFWQPLLGCSQVMSPLLQTQKKISQGADHLANLFDSLGS